MCVNGLKLVLVQVSYARVLLSMVTVFCQIEKFQLTPCLTHSELLKEFLLVDWFSVEPHVCAHLQTSYGQGLHWTKRRRLNR